jgi:hypothetical protein
VPHNYKRNAEEIDGIYERLSKNSSEIGKKKLLQMERGFNRSSEIVRVSSLVAPTALRQNRVVASRSYMDRMQPHTPWGPEHVRRLATSDSQLFLSI